MEQHIESATALSDYFAGNDGLSRAPQIDFRYERNQKSDDILKITCSIQLNLHKEPPEVGLVEK